MIEPTPFKENGIPQFADLKAMWSGLSVRQHPHGPAISEYAQALDAVFTNGHVRLGSFLVPVDPVFDWFASRNQLHQMWFFEKFWGISPVADLMPETLTPELNFLSQDVFVKTSPFHLGGSFAWALASGGANGEHEQGSVHAKEIGENAARDWIDDRYEEVLVYESGIAWSEFFAGVAWDFSWVCLDKRTRAIHVLFGTDSD